MTKKAIDRLWLRAFERQYEATKQPPVALVRLLNILRVVSWEAYGEYMTDLNQKMYQLRRERSVRMNKAERRKESATTTRVLKEIRPTKSR